MRIEPDAWDRVALGIGNIVIVVFIIIAVSILLKTVFMFGWNLIK